MNKELVDIIADWLWLNDQDTKGWAILVPDMIKMLEQQGYVIIKKKDWDGLIDMTHDKIRNVLEGSIIIKKDDLIKEAGLIVAEKLGVK